MSTENDTLQGGDGQDVPVADTAPDTQPAPKSDAEAAEREPKQPEADKEPKKDEPAKDDGAERKKNRTRDYINRINGENAELRRRLADIEQRLPAKAEPDKGAEPKLEDYDYDVTAFQREHAKWAVSQALKDREESTQQAESARQQQEIVVAYNQKVADFADAHPDFPEVVGSIAFPLSQELQAAIMAHENGPAIAYHLGNNDDDAFALASIQPQLAAAAVDRLAMRLAAPKAPQPPAPPATPDPKPVSQAPAPVPTVSGRSPTETPPEKLTDDQWYERERARRRG